MYWFLVRPKWLLFLVGCIALAAAFVSLGLWQFDRLDQRRALNDRVLDARQAAPVAPGALLRTDRPPPRADEFRKVVASGRYDAAHEYLVRSRTVADRPGLFVLTPLVTVDGTVLLVVRGWVEPSPKGAGVAPDVPRPPTGEVRVVGRVRLSERGNLQSTRIGPYTAVKRIDVERLAGELSRDTFRGYVELIEQEPAADGKLVRVSEPELDEGPHLSYGVQWFLFAVMAFVGYGIYARRERDARRAADGASDDSPVSPAVTAAPPGP